MEDGETKGKKQRVDPSRKLREQVMKEYDHRCAICGSRGPQLHHINEDPSDNDPMNLIPLCPNCHLTDQHDPTRHIEQGLLRLFRRYRDPMILLPQFYPVYRRARALTEPEDGKNPANEVAYDLCNFIEELEMGAYYVKKIRALVRLPSPPPVGSVSYVHGEPVSSPYRQSDRRAIPYH